MNLTGAEFWYVIGVLASGMPSGETEQISLNDVANFIGASGGGGGPSSRQEIDSGTTGNLALLGSINIFNSATAGDKFLPIPASTGSKKSIWVFDYYGNAGTYPITPQPVSGPAIVGVNQVYTNNGSIQLYDDLLGWLSV